MIYFLSVNRYGDLKMLSDLLQKLMEEPTPEEIKVSDILKSICYNDYQTHLDTIVALQYFRDIDNALIIDKINAANTPLIRAAMQYEH